MALSVTSWGCVCGEPKSKIPIRNPNFKSKSVEYKLSVCPVPEMLSGTTNVCEVLASMFGKRDFSFFVSFFLFLLASIFGKRELFFLLSLFFFSFFLNLGEREKEREGGRGSDSPCVWERKWKSPNCNSPCVNERESGRVQIAILCQWKREWKSPNSHGFGSVHLNSLGEFSMFLCWLKCLPTVGNCWPREMFMTGYPVTTRIHLKNSLLDNFNKSRSTKFLESNIFLFAQGVKRMY